MQSIYQKKFLILSIIFFLIFFAMFIFLYKNIVNNKDNALSAEKEWQIENARRENVKHLFSSVNAVEKERNLLETHFVKSSDVVPFLDTIEKLAREVNLESEVSSVDIPKNEVALIVEMKVSGSFQNIYKLITLLENSQYELEFSSIDLKNTDSSVGKISQWNAVFQIKLLSFVN